MFTYDKKKRPHESEVFFVFTILSCSRHRERLLHEAEYRLEVTAYKTAILDYIWVNMLHLLGDVVVLLLLVEACEFNLDDGVRLVVDQLVRCHGYESCHLKGWEFNEHTTFLT